MPHGCSLVNVLIYDCLCSSSVEHLIQAIRIHIPKTREWLSGSD